MICLICSSHVEKTLNFNTFFYPPKQTPICDACSDALQPSQGSKCFYCSGLCEEKICSDCLTWKRLRPEMDTLDSNYAVFPYSSFIQTLFAQWKYRGDFELGEVFKPFVQEIVMNQLKIDPSTIIVPIPLSEQRLYERAFNQAEVIATWITPEVTPLLVRKDHEKQAKKSKYERITSKNPFNLSNSINKPVLLVDDIYTTGTTLRHASTILKKNGCPKVDAFTLIRS